MAEEGARPTWRRRAARNRNIVVGAAILTVVILAALLAGVISTHDPRRLNPAQRLQAPSAMLIVSSSLSAPDLTSTFHEACSSAAPRTASVTGNEISTRC